MEYQQSRNEVNHILSGAVSVLTARGEGIADAVRDLPPRAIPGRRTTIVRSYVRPGAVTVVGPG